MKDKANRGILTGEPLSSHVALNVIARCNSSCVFCFEGKRVGQVTPSTEEAKRVIDLAAVRGRSVVFMGGEALLRTDIVELIAYTRGLGLGSSLFTNGMALAKPGLLEACVDAGLQGLHISVNAWDRTSWSRTTGLPEATYDRFLEGLRSVRAWFKPSPLRRFFPSLRRPRPFFVDFHLLSFAGNVSRLDDIVAFVLETVFGMSGPGWGAPDIPMQPNFLIKGYGAAADQGSVCAGLAAAPDVERQSLQRVAHRFSARALIRFSMIPLCQVPGQEHNSIEVRYLASGCTVSSNFENKRGVAEMAVSRWNAAPTEFKAICSKCSLVGLCGGPRAPSGLPGTTSGWSCEYAPEASSVSAAAVLVEAGMQKEEASMRAVALHEAAMSMLAGDQSGVSSTLGRRQHAGRSPLAERVHLALEVELGERRGVFGGYEAGDVQDHLHSESQPALRVHFSGNGVGAFVVDALPMSSGEAAVEHVAGFGLRCSWETPMDSPERALLVQSLAAALARSSLLSGGSS